MAATKTERASQRRSSTMPAYRPSRHCAVGESASGCSGTETMLPHRRSRRNLEAVLSAEEIVGHDVFVHRRGARVLAGVVPVVVAAVQVETIGILGAEDREQVHEGDSGAGRRLGHG